VHSKHSYLFYALTQQIETGTAKHVKVRIPCRNDSIMQRYVHVLTYVFTVWLSSSLESSNEQLYMALSRVVSEILII